MGCRCSKPDLDSFEREERLMLEHAAQAEKNRVQIHKTVRHYWEKNGECKETLGCEDHYKVYHVIVPTLAKSKWKQYLTRRTTDVIMNTAHRKGIYDDSNQKFLKSEAGELVYQHLLALENKESSAQLWRLLANDKEKVPLSEYCQEFSQKFNSVLESIYRIVVHHVITFHLQKIVRKEETTIRSQSRSRSAARQPAVCSSITAC
mmetsp:Transcript_16886/g.23623  ORF Transcript_16886/g.23623 Transcript_16886/m.23623 type:complete len:205 (+) Transcript_16886:148-762(+)